jgi:branched-chain amino acid transport system permease protein
MLAAIYSLLASGMTLIYGIMHILNFTHGEIYMLGGYALWLFYARLNLNFGLSLILTMIVIGALGFLIYRLFFARIGFGVVALNRGVILTLGMSLFLQQGVARVFGESELKPPTVFEGVIGAGGAHISVERVAVIAAAVVIMVALHLFITRNRHGMAMIAVEQDTEAASLAGVSMKGISALCMTLGFILAAAAGGLMAPVVFVNPAVGLPVILKSIAIIILGGFGSIEGAIYAAIIVAFAESFAVVLFDVYVSIIVVFGLLVLILLFRPQGLKGHA